MLLKCDEIKKAVKDYNAANPTEDDELKLALASIRGSPSSVGRALAEVCLIADWGSINLTHFPFLERVAMAHEIAACGSVLQPIQSCRLENLDADGTKMLMGVVQRDLQETSLLQPPGTKRHQLSFLSKYLHWRVNDAFPIWDGNARKALNCRNDDRSWNSYKGWLNCVRTEALEHKGCCLEDVRLPGESLLRTLDKALYMLGRPASQ